jgi:SAM-dependent methyltransferase
LRLAGCPDPGRPAQYVTMRKALRALKRALALRSPRRWLAGSPDRPADDYSTRLAAEAARFREDLDVHALPAIFDYWSNRYLRPRLQAFGFSDPDDFFAERLSACLSKSGPGARIVSLGAGNCDTEVRICQALIERGHTDFAIECLEINSAMLDRGRVLAETSGVAAQLHFRVADLNGWAPDGRYDAVMANQSLHHIVELERLFDGVKRSLAPHGRFVVSDMIGRNGHRRWPEARAIVEEFWPQLPRHYRYHRQLSRQEDDFLDWDCSVEGFEGIRSQDILPLLCQRFGFDVFIGFANVIDPFIDRGFGHNFDAEAAWDRAFIDGVHERDTAEIAAGRIKPTHMLAVLCSEGPGDSRYDGGLSPMAAVRDPSA